MNRKLEPGEFARLLAVYVGGFTLAFVTISALGIGLCRTFVSLGGLSRETAFNEGSLTAIYFFSFFLSAIFSGLVGSKATPKEPPDVEALKKHNENLREIVSKLTGGGEEE